jgi:hypothetical protein
MLSSLPPRCHSEGIIEQLENSEYLHLSGFKIHLIRFGTFRKSFRSRRIVGSSWSFKTATRGPSVLFEKERREEGQRK